MAIETLPGTAIHPAGANSRRGTDMIQHLTKIWNQWPRVWFV
jgi:hypothetical protein